MASPEPQHFFPPERPQAHGRELPLWTVLVVAAGVLLAGLGSSPGDAEDGGVAVARAAERAPSAVSRVGGAGELEGHAQLAMVSSAGEASRSTADRDDAVDGERERSTRSDVGSTGPDTREQIREGGLRVVGDDVRGPGKEPNEAGPYRNGLRHGEWITRDHEGTIRERGSYEAGRRVGPWETFGVTGALMEWTEFEDGERHGDWRAFADDGALVGEGSHDHNLRDGEWTLWYSDGRVKERGTYVNGLREGLWEFFDDLGEPTHRSGTYRAGIKID